MNLAACSSGQQVQSNGGGGEGTATGWAGRGRRAALGVEVEEVCDRAAGLGVWTGVEHEEVHGCCGLPAATRLRGGRALGSAAVGGRCAQLWCCAGAHTLRFGKELPMKVAAEALSIHVGRLRVNVVEVADGAGLHGVSHLLLEAVRREHVREANVEHASVIHASACNLSADGPLEATHELREALRMDGDVRVLAQELDGEYQGVVHELHALEELGVGVKDRMQPLAQRSAHVHGHGLEVDVLEASALCLFHPAVFSRPLQVIDLVVSCSLQDVVHDDDPYHLAARALGEAVGSEVPGQQRVPVIPQVPCVLREHCEQGLQLFLRHGLEDEPPILGEPEDRPRLPRRLRAAAQQLILRQAGKIRAVVDASQLPNCGEPLRVANC
mmetsp:Transcript_4512/g.13385  ORF Transcript_4512/g.13385 Transcript_4512/m.13385 type:complete len:384 (+) Transcript_4512:2-1153(+)